MRIARHSYVCRRMAQTHLDRLHIGPIRNQQRRVRMPEVMETKTLPAVGVSSCAPPVLEYVHIGSKTSIVANHKLIGGTTISRNNGLTP